jgi:5'-AMP-activated protein kinase catalytic alpha subunit
MIAGKEYVGKKVDTWSSGIVLYAMVCGYLPFDEETTQKLYKKILTGSYSIPR